MAAFSLDYHADDEIACGYFSARDKEQVLVFRGHGLGTRRAGTVDIVSYFAGESPGDRWALDGLMNVDGAWAARLATNWTTEGKTYMVEYTSQLGTEPFQAIAAGIAATPPRNTYVDEIRHEAGFYRLREE